MNNNILIFINITLVIFFIAIYFIYFKKSIELFDILPSNSRTNYKNIGIYSWTNSSIQSIPTDIVIDDTNSNYYELDNNKYLSKLKDAFLINNDKLIKITNNIIWSKWIYPNDARSDENDILANKYSQIYNYILNNIKKNIDNDIDIIKDKFKCYRYNKLNKNEILIDMDILLYRKNKLNGKHCNLLVTINNNTIDVVYIKIIGIVNQDVMQEIRGHDINNDNISTFITSSLLGQKIHDYQDTIYNITDDYTNNNIETILYNTIIKNNDNEKDDYNNILNKLDKTDRERIDYMLLELHNNKQYTNDYIITHNHYLNNIEKNIQNNSSTNIYKNYPYKEDFTIM